MVRWMWGYAVALTMLMAGVGCSSSTQDGAEPAQGVVQRDMVESWRMRIDPLTVADRTAHGATRSFDSSLVLLRAVEEVWPDSAWRMAQRIIREAEAANASEPERAAKLVAASIASQMMHDNAREFVQQAVADAMELGPEALADEARLRAVRAGIVLQDTSILRFARDWREAQGLELSAARSLLAARIADTAAFRSDRNAVAVTLAMDTTASERRVRAIMAMADAFDRAAQPDSAYRWVLWAGREAERAGSPLHVAQCKELQAFIEVNSGRIAEAGDHMLQALDLYHRLNAIWHVPEAERELAYIYWGSLDADTVRNRFLHAMRLADAIGNQRSSCTNRLYYGKFLVSLDSLSLHRWGISYPARFDSGMAYLNDAYVRASVLPDRWLRINVLEGMGAILNHKGDIHGSLAMGERTLAAYTELGSKPWIARSTGALLPDLYSLGEYAKVIELGERTVKLAREAGMPNVETEALIRLYWANRQLGNHKLALEQKLRVDSLKDLYSSNAAVEELARANERHKAEQEQLTDSLAHTQALAVEKATAEARIQRQRTTTWTLAGIGVLLLIGAGGFFLLDRKRRRAQFERDAARLEKEAARFETQALRSQMNPHFIFNALNSISGYIQGNDPDQAQTFLARVAKLMRAVLENSQFAEVPLRKDLEVLRAYMELERTRAQGKFAYSIDVDPGLDADEVLVPPLLAQPFVENAIWHGIAGKTGHGHIRVRVGRTNDQLTITVEDDGVGRSASKSAVSKEKTSLGTAITRARLDLVQKQKGGSAGFAYTDLPQGTRVDIHLPLQRAA